MSDAEAHWIQAAARGDARAFRHLVERHARPLHRVCQRLLGDASSAEDALQEAFLHAWRGLARFDGRSAFGSWLHRIAINAALAQLRQRRPETGFDPGDEDDTSSPWLLDASDDPFDQASGHQLGQQLEGALRLLTPAERSAFVLRHFEHCPMDEIAVALDSNVNACKQAVFRAVRKLRTALAPTRSAP